VEKRSIDIFDSTIEYSVMKRAGKCVAVIDSARAQGEKLTVPAMLGDSIVYELGKKSFMGARVKKLEFSEGLTEIGNWAFYGMKRLTEITIPNTVLSFGREIFEKSDKLERIYYGSLKQDETEEKSCEEEQLMRKAYDAKAMLLAAIIVVASDYDLLIQAADISWFTLWDEHVLEYLDIPDETGFSPVLAGGEEDYITNESDIDCHRRLMRCGKVRLCFMRLMNDIYISDKARKRYNEYLESLNINKDYKDAWNYVKRESVNDFSVCQIFDRAGLFKDELVKDMLIDIGEENVELKAFLIGKQGEKVFETDSFSQFDL